LRNGHNLRYRTDLNTLAFATVSKRNLELTMKDDSFCYGRLDTQIAEEAALDGLSVVRSPSRGRRKSTDWLQN
jgi:hypothetical protein